MQYTMYNYRAGCILCVYGHLNEYVATKLLNGNGSTRALCDVVACRSTFYMPVTWNRCVWSAVVRLVIWFNVTMCSERRTSWLSVFFRSSERWSSARRPSIAVSSSSLSCSSFWRRLSVRFKLFPYSKRQCNTYHPHRIENDVELSLYITWVLVNKYYRKGVFDT